MKLIEKLSNEYSNSNEVATGTHGGFEISWRAYEAGFCKAREMAAEVIKEWDTSWYEEDTKLEAQRHHRETIIRYLGESEAE